MPPVLGTEPPVSLRLPGLRCSPDKAFTPHPGIQRQDRDELFYCWAALNNILQAHQTGIIDIHGFGWAV